MNRQLLPYVNFLLEHEPSPFCDYILSKELLASGDDTVLDAYDWARRFPLYTELLQEQLPDGSWYGFCDAVTELTKRRKYKTTARAMLRMRDLSLPLSDPMLVKTLVIGLFFLATGPIAGHSICQGAYRAGVRPEREMVCDEYGRDEFDD